MQELHQFKCRSVCRHTECQRHANLGIIDRNDSCEYAKQELTGSSLFLENIIDLSHTLAQIMILCGIHECKAKMAVDIITYSFLHYDLVCYCLDTKPTKRLRKEDIFHELGRKCLMNRVEAHLCYTILKRGFKAFYYRPTGVEEGKECDSSYSEECVFVHAAKKTAESYAQFDGLTCDEQRGIEAKIMVLYKKFFDRMQSRKTKPANENCNCCFCAKNRGHLVYGKPPPCAEVQKPKTHHTCPHCCKRKKAQKIIHGKSVRPKCPVCHRSRNFCTCEKYDFNINWIGSIWSRPDMNLYYTENIEKEHLETIPGCSPQDCDLGEDDADKIDDKNREDDEDANPLEE